MIETKVLKIRNEDLDESIKTEAVFDWKVVNKEMGAYKTTVSFERENDVPYYDEMIAKEKEWHKQMDIKYYPVYILLAIALLVLTSSAVVRLALRGFEYLNIIVFSLLGLGFAIFVAGGLTFYFIIKKVQKTLPLYYEKRRDYMLEMEKLRNHEKQD